MVKNDLVKKVSNITEVSRKDTEAVINALSEVIADTLSADKTEKITLPGIGTFKVKHVSERSGVTALGDKKPWTKPAHDEIVFKVSKTVKEV